MRELHFCNAHVTSLKHTGLVSFIHWIYLSHIKLMLDYELDTERTVALGLRQQQWYHITNSKNIW